MDRYLCRQSELANSLPLVDPSTYAERLPHKTKAVTATMVTVEVLDLKLQALLQCLTQGGNWSSREWTDTLETKFDNIMQYVHVLEEENSNLKYTVFQLQMQ